MIKIRRFFREKRLFYIFAPMKRSLYLFILTLIPTCLLAQAPRGGKGGFSLSNLSKGSNKVPDSLLIADSTELKSKKVIAYRLTPLLGDAYGSYGYQYPQYSQQYFSRRKRTGDRLSGESWIGSSDTYLLRTERMMDFIFADAYDYYITTPENARFYDTKTPFTDIMYTTGGSSTNKEEQLVGTLAINFGKKINVGGDFDYIYGRGHYNSNGNKLVNYRVFGSYRSDRYELNAYFRGLNYVTHENGGLTNDAVLTNPDDYAEGKKQMMSKDFPVKYTDVFNRIQGKELFLTHRYNLGFIRELDETDEEGYAKEVFVPVSSIIHTFQYEDMNRQFTAPNSTGIDTLYNQGMPFNYDENLNDLTYYWQMKNTFALSLREGFQNWVKFGLTAFIDLEKRRYQMQDGKRDYTQEGNSSQSSFSSPFIQGSSIATYDEFSTFIGAELYKRRGNSHLQRQRRTLCSG